MSDAVTPNKPCLLLVNDHEDTLLLLKRALMKAGFDNILQAGDGREAIRQLGLHPVDLLITDVHMPYLDGWRLARMVRSGLFRCSSGIPIIVVSGTYADRIAEVTAREYGINRFVPLLPQQGYEAVLSAVSDCLSGRDQGLSKPTLLIVEDDPDTAILARRMLQRRFEVETAGDGQAGLEAWRAGRHKLVLLDIMLPRLSGVEVLGAILAESPKQAVVIMTANATLNQSEIVMLAGATDFIAKPFEAEQLRRVCEIALRRDDFMVSNEQFLARLRENSKVIRELQTMKFALDQHCIVGTADTTGRIIHVNEKSCEISQYQPEELIGQFPHILNHSCHPKSFFDEMWETVKSGTVWHGEMKNRKKDGGFYWTDTTVIPYMDAQGRPYQYVAIRTDITARKQAEQELIGTRDQALAALRLKSEFLANMSHEIRTPMNAILGMAELMQDTLLTGEQSDYLKTLRQSGESLLHIINDILDLSKIEAGKMPLERVDFSLVEMVESVLEALTPAARQKRLSLMSYVAPEIVSLLKGDPGRMRQVLMNLVGNAIKFTEQGGVVVRATLELGDDAHSTVRITVTDTGVGIPEQIRDKLFQPFTQADGTTTRKYGGTGLGLSICKNLITMMGGEVGIESETGKGTTFWFTLPFMHGSEQPSSVKHEAERHDYRAAAEGIGAVRVLVVDDSPDQGEVVHQYLTSWGLQNDRVESAAQALDLMRAAVADRAPYHVAIIARVMLGMDGYQLARAIRSDESFNATKLIMLTAFDVQEHHEQALQAGYSGFLTKPLRQSDLFDCLADLYDITTIQPYTAQSAPPPAAKAVEHSSRLLLLVEDNPVNRKLAMMQLKKLGFTAHTTNNGREALTALRLSRYDLILMDCQMPEMDGYEATGVIRTMETESGLHTPIIAMTANAMAGDRERCIAAGMDDYLSKPVGIEQLRVKIQRWLPELPAAQHAIIEDQPAPVAKSPAMDDKALDKIRALQMEGEPDLLSEIIASYLGDAPVQLEAIHRAVATGDAEGLRRSAHSMKSSSANLGATVLSSLCKELEEMGRSGDLRQAAQKCQQAQREFDAARRALEVIRSGVEPPAPLSRAV
ncbi:MAG TPA: response regulator [Gammaproteobacteria bacterium]|nr:response regulator [Gammaproteobacteria bacterium]